MGWPREIERRQVTLVSNTEKGLLWQVYVVKCSDGSLYTGIARNLHDRIAAHNQGSGAKYTRSRLPVTLVYAEQANDRSAALRREHAIKKLSRNEKIKLIATQS
jgi:putative endonuclease